MSSDPEPLPSVVIETDSSKCMEVFYILLNINLTSPSPHPYSNFATEPLIEIFSDFLIYKPF